MAAIGAYSEYLVFAPLVAIAIGIYFYQTETTAEMPAKAAAIATAAGVLAVGFLLLLFIVILEPSAADVSIGDEFTGLLGITLGSVAAAAGTGYVLEEDPLDIF